MSSNYTSDNERDPGQVDPLSQNVSDFSVTRRDVLQIGGGAAALALLPNGYRPAYAQIPEEAAGQALDVSLTVNGTPTSLQLDPRLSVLDMLRERLDLTGTKKGCNQGACGACTVLIDGVRVNACLALAVMHDGASITTIEGVANGEDLHPLQDAFIAHDAFQCGYCTSGQIMSGLSCISEGHAGSPEEISYWMSGNICRCGAYPGIVAAISQVASEDRT